MDEDSKDSEPNLINGNRNSIRLLAFQSALRLNDESLNLIVCNAVYLILKIMICVSVILNNKNHTDTPLTTFIIVLIGVDAVFLVSDAIKLVNIIFAKEIIKTIVKVVQNLALL